MAAPAGPVFRCASLDLVRALALAAAAACADAVAPKPAHVDVYAAAPVDDVATVIRSAEVAERDACRALGLDPPDACAVR